MFSEVIIITKRKLFGITDRNNNKAKQFYGYCCRKNNSFQRMGNNCG